MTSEYIYFARQRIARRDSSGNVFYYFTDHLGTSRDIVQSGSTSACYDADFYPFGGERSYTTTCSQTYKFTGQERDSESNLDNFKARLFSSQYGRFTSPDPLAGDIGDPQSLNRYAYVRNNPLTFTDPSGETTCDANGNNYFDTVTVNGNDDCASFCGIGGGGGGCGFTCGGGVGSASCPFSDLPCGGGGGCQPMCDWGNNTVNALPPSSPATAPTSAQQSQGVLQKAGQLLSCAASTANEASLAGLFNVNTDQHPFLGSLLGNTFSGIVDAAGNVGSIFTGPDRLAATAQTLGTVATGGVTMGIPVGERLGMLGSGVVGAAQDAFVNVVAQPAATLTLAKATQAAGWTAAKVFGWGKVAVDAGIFAGSAIYCAGH